MKKLIYVLATSIFAMGLMMGCSKKDDITPNNGNNGGNNNSGTSSASWGVTVHDKTTDMNVEGAQVFLYDASNDKNVSLLTTDANGYVCFANLSVDTKYYVAVQYEDNTYTSNERKTLSVGFNKLTFHIETTAMIVTVKENSSGYTVSDATIKVFGSVNDMKNKTNSLLTLKTNSNGMSMIIGATAYKTYYLYATNGTKTAYVTKKCDIGANRFTINLTSGDLKFVNNNSDPYIFTATNTTTGTVYTYVVSGGTSKILKNCETGYYNFSYEQKSGYMLWPTTGEFDPGTLNDNHIVTLTKN
ncbi:MAG: hypothetical protein J6Y55_08725 [Bacteroidales bacterium]|nr:hypothetical protein [Bacteroidales bacterium]